VPSSPVRVAISTRMRLGFALVESRKRSAIVALTALVFCGCKSEFTGPYPCETGYDSCVNPERNQCETDLTSEALHCGACGNPCQVGALCVDSTCVGGARKLADISSAPVPKLAVNSTGLYWSSDQNQIMTLALSGGSPSPMLSNVSGCGNPGVPFALSDNAIYYWSNDVACPSGGGCKTAGLVSSSIPGGAVTLLVENSQSLNIGCPTAFALDNSHVYWMGNQNNNLVVMSSSLTGANVSTLGTLVGAGSVDNNLVVTKSLVLFSSKNGPMQLQAIPLAGTAKGPTTIPTKINGKDSGFTSFVANESYAFVASGGCPCGDNKNNSTFPIGTIARFALDGSEGVNFAQFTGVVNSMQLDAGYLYWATDTTVYKMATKGGTPQKLADNLVGAISPNQCNGDCSNSFSSTVAIAVDANSVYIADSSPNVNAILRVGK
jgi:hypothetical protein